MGKDNEIGSEKPRNSCSETVIVPIFAGSQLECRFLGPSSVASNAEQWWGGPRVHIFIKQHNDSNAGGLASRNSASGAKLHIYLLAS